MHNASCMMHDASSCHNLGWCHCHFRTAATATKVNFEFDVTGLFFAAVRAPFWLCFYSIDSTKWVTRFGIYNKISEGNNNPLPWWWFQMFFIFTPTWGNDQILPSYGWFNHHLVVRFPFAISSCSKFARKPKLREELEEKVKAQHKQNHPKSAKMFSFIFGLSPLPSNS